MKDSTGTIQDNTGTIQDNNFTIKEANILYVILLFAFIFAGLLLPRDILIAELLITEFGIILVPSILYAIFRKKTLKNVFRFKKLPVTAVLKVITLAILLLPFVAISNMITLFFISYFGKPIISVIPQAQSFGEFIVLFLVIAGSAGLCEEILFRGVILNAYESEMGKKWGAVFSGLLFGLFHLNPQNILGPILLGIMFSYLVQITGSIWAAVTAHMTNNGISVILGYLMNVKGPKVPGDSELLFTSSSAIIEAIVIYAIIGCISFIGIRRILKSLKVQFAKRESVMTNDDAFETSSDSEIIINNENGSTTIHELAPKFQWHKVPYMTLGITLCIYVFLVYSMYK